MRRSRIAVALWLVLNVLFFWLVGLASGGYSLRGYAPGESDKVNLYSPVVYTSPGDEPTEMLYMVDYRGNIEYYIVWEDEHFSNPVIDRIYRFIRGLVYGTTEDIEVVEVNPDDGIFHFQTFGHTQVEGEINPNGSCSLGERSIEKCTLNGTHLRVYVVTWNHMMSLLPESPSENLREVRPPLRPMTPEDYVSLGMMRRTQKTIGGITVNAMITAILSTVLLNLSILIAWKTGYLHTMFRLLKKRT